MNTAHAEHKPRLSQVQCTGRCSEQQAGLPHSARHSRALAQQAIVQVQLRTAEVCAALSPRRSKIGVGCDCQVVVVGLTRHIERVFAAWMLVERRTVTASKESHRSKSGTLIGNHYLGVLTWHGMRSKEVISDINQPSRGQEHWRRLVLGHEVGKKGGNADERRQKFLEGRLQDC